MFNVHTVSDWRSYVYLTFFCYSNQPDYYSSQYSARAAASYEHIPQGAMGYHMATAGARRDMSYPEHYPNQYYFDRRDKYLPPLLRESNAVKRSPYIPDMLDDLKVG